jgi:hypothetical protein
MMARERGLFDNWIWKARMNGLEPGHLSLEAAFGGTSR